jgi:catechol 2,3-dioxygenase-like lactoylglutathione lyase family enzyme
VNIETISAVTLNVASMTNSVRFYRDVLGMQIIYAAKKTVFPHSVRMRERGPSSICKKVIP